MSGRISTGKSLKLNYISASHQIAWSDVYVWFSKFRDMRNNNKKTNVRLVRHAHVTFYVFNQCQATGGRCSHICTCKVAPHHPSCKHAFTPTQTDLRCARAACHVHPLTRVRITGPQSSRDTSIYDSFTFRYQKCVKPCYYWGIWLQREQQQSDVLGWLRRGLFIRGVTLKVWRSVILFRCFFRWFLMFW